jgi:alkylated DNA repair dioxygenase AlkB
MNSHELHPGLFLFESRVAPHDQQTLWSLCESLAHGAVPMYTPTVRGGAKMSVGMLCLGRHWNAVTYAYEDRRSDFDAEPVPPVPDAFAALARGAAADAGFDMKPDLCIMNYYTADSRMGVHQDKDERPDTIAAGIPIVSVSLGDTARFDERDHVAVGRRARDGRPVAPPLSRRHAHPAGHGS